MNDPAADGARRSFAATADGGDAFACALCGLRFTHGGEVCASCPIAVGCDDIVRCPRCGYQFPRRSRLVSWVQSLLARVRRHRGAPPLHPVRTLDRLRPGEHARVIAIGSAEPAVRMKLSHLGIVAGAEVALQQARPAAVVRVGETTVALQTSVAASIHVRVA